MKTRISDFRKTRNESTSEELKEVNSRLESKGASPMLGGSRTAGGIKKTERKTMRLPISGDEIELKSVELAPSNCQIHPRNQRVQSLLKLSNPKVAQLRDSLKREGQREPVLARWITVADQKILEILDGSRRRFACEDLYRENKEILLRAWVGLIGDADAEHLAKAGNDDRDDISSWELSQYLKAVENENPSWSHEVIAANERMSRTNVSNLLAIADIPIEVVSLLESPDLLKVNSGLKVLKLLRNTKDKNYIKFLEKEAPFTKFSELANRLKDLLSPKPSSRLPSANRKVEIKSGTKLRASIGSNRKKEGQFKVDLFGLSDEEYQKILSALESILK